MSTHYLIEIYSKEVKNMLGRKGQQMGVIGFILFAVTVIIGVIVYAAIDTSLGATLTGASKAAKGNVNRMCTAYTI